MNLDIILKALNLDKAGDVFQNLFGISAQDLIQFLIRLAIAVIIYILLCKLIDHVTKRVFAQIADKKNIDVSVLLYGSSIIRFGSRIILVLILISFAGVQSNTITGVFTVISGGIALASQDIVKDFLAGINIMLTKAFTVDDYIIIPGQNVEGYVKTISMFHVILLGRGNRTITIPAATVFRANVINITAEGDWLMELKVGITYEDNIKVAREVILEVAREEPLVLQERKAEVILSELGESSVDLLVLVWTKKADHFTAYWRLQENIKLALEANGITIAYNQLDVHLGKLDERTQAAELAEKKWNAAKKAKSEKPPIEEK